MRTMAITTTLIIIVIFILLFYILLKVTKIIFKLAFILLIIVFGIIVVSPPMFDRIKCEVKGGEFIKETLTCNEKTKDYSKSCIDKIDCEGECIVKDENSISGLCSKYRIVRECGKYIIRDKVVKQILC